MASVLFTDVTQAFGRACIPAGGDLAPRGQMTVSGHIIDTTRKGKCHRHLVSKDKG